ncbi:hypothetical protein SO802_027615 [Lithocarpus litseifolius]|uniref:IMS import disulfide relay-system CHCH-CHCH-like Cx9C domain-containing protein n=1 Tax=Lithocarpus litseifolius TaxID=425828 RepID=A0AAW2C2W2_9ROSI
MTHLCDQTLVYTSDLSSSLSHSDIYLASLHGTLSLSLSAHPSPAAAAAAPAFKYRIMGRKAGSLYINPKKFTSLHKPCMTEMIAFLNCLAVNNNSNDKCVRQKELLSVCMDSQCLCYRQPIKESLGEALITTCRGLAEEESSLGL